jgi:myo-inositol-1(or 4)-monophosphatase
MYEHGDVNRSALLNVMCNAAIKASRCLVRDFGEVEQLQVSTKGPGDFVSAADHKAEKILYEELSKARPQYGFLMEESGRIQGQDDRFCWVIDPLDGTTNFLHGIPHFAISIALEKEGELLAGVIYNPILDEMYTAEKGAGAFLNNRRLRVSGRKKLSEGVLSTGLSVDPSEMAEIAKILYYVRPQVASVRSFGATSLDLAYVAAGRLDGFWYTQFGPWDIAAGIILIREAGGKVSEINGGKDILKNKSILASNQYLHSLISKLLTHKA